MSAFVNFTPRSAMFLILIKYVEILFKEVYNEKANISQKGVHP